MSAPDRSSFAVINSSKSTSSASVIREVCNLTNQSIDETVNTIGNLPEDMAFGLDVGEREFDLSVDTSWSNQSGV